MPNTYLSPFCVIFNDGVYDVYDGFHIVAVVLGREPPPLIVVLSVGGPFSAALVSSVNWPAGVAIDLRFTGPGSPVLWVATIVTNRASWNKTIAQVNAVLAYTSVDLRYTESGGEAQIWSRGSVRLV